LIAILLFFGLKEKKVFTSMLRKILNKNANLLSARGMMWNKTLLFLPAGRF